MNTDSALRRFGTLYDEGRRQITELVLGLPDPKMVSVPACPPWTAHDLVSHLTGNCADVAKGNIQGLATEAWTQAQVDERKERTTELVLDEWAEIGPMFAQVVDDFPGRYGRMTVGDITVHEHDIRGAISQPGNRDSAAVEAATDFAITTMVHSGCRALGVGPLEIRAGDRRWVVGTGESATDDPEEWRVAVSSDQIPDIEGAPVASVSGELFEVFRSVTGRRSADQVRALDWNVEPDRYLPTFGFGPFALRSSDLDE